LALLVAMGAAIFLVIVDGRACERRADQAHASKVCQGSGL
jgi:hypothetical protein